MSFENAHDNSGTLQETIIAWREDNYTEIGVDRTVTKALIYTLDDACEDPLWDQKIRYRPDFVETTCEASAIEVFDKGINSFLKTDILLQHSHYWNANDSFYESYLLQIDVTDNTYHLPAYRTWLAIKRYPRYDSLSLLSSIALRWAVWGSGRKITVDEAVEWDGVVRYDLDQIQADLDAFGHTLRANARYLYPNLYDTDDR